MCQSCCGSCLITVINHWQFNGWFSYWCRLSPFYTRQEQFKILNSWDLKLIWKDQVLHPELTFWWTVPLIVDNWLQQRSSASTAAGPVPSSAQVAGLIPDLESKVTSQTSFHSSLFSHKKIFFTCRKKTCDVTGDVTMTGRRGRGHFQGTIYYMNIETGERSEVIWGQLTFTLSYRDQYCDQCQLRVGYSVLV